MSDNSPSWKPDPTGKHDHRYWDGSQWTDNISDAGVAGTDPYEAGAAADADATVADASTVADAPASPEPPAPLDPTVATPVPPAPDTTAAWPTTPAAPGGPTPPPPYVPTAPGSGGGGSKRGLLVGGGILAAIAIAVVAFLALGSDDDDSNVRAQLASKLQEEIGAELSDDDADCLADFFVDDLGEDAFDDVDFDAEEAPPELQDAFVESGENAVEACNIDEAALGTDGGTDGGTDDTDGSTDGDAEEGEYGSDPELDALYDACGTGDYEACDQLYNDSPPGSEYEAFGETCGEINDPSGSCVNLYEGEDGGTDDATDSGDLDSYEEVLTDTFESTLGISREQAECLAGNMRDAIESGDLSEDEAYTEYLDFLQDCDIDLSEIGGN
jgi:hypothetical protein